MNDDKHKRLKNALRGNLARRKADAKQGLHRPKKHDVLDVDKIITQTLTK